MKIKDIKPVFCIFDSANLLSTFTEFKRKKKNLDNDPKSYRNKMRRIGKIYVSAQQTVTYNLYASNFFRSFHKLNIFL